MSALDAPQVGAASGIEDWLQAVSARRASPAAGSAVAISAALGAALLIKQARLSSLEALPEREQLVGKLVAARDGLLALAEADAAAIAAWLRMRRLAEDDPAHCAAVQSMAEMPLDAMALCQAALLAAQPLLERGCPGALADGQVGAQMLAAGQRAFGLLAEANLSAVRDPTIAEAIRSRLRKTAKDIPSDPAA